MLSKKTFLGKTSSHATTDINRAFVFNSKEEAKASWSKYKKDLKDAWHFEACPRLKTWDIPR